MISWMASITVDNLEVAQFIYLLLNNEAVRDVLNTITSKTVLILGRFTKQRKVVLDALRDRLKTMGFVPVLFDFPPSRNRDLTETIQLLAGMAKFVIADLTDPKSVPQELGVIVPGLPSVPVQPVIQGSQKEYSMFEHWLRYPWVAPVLRYQNREHLLESIEARMGDGQIVDSGDEIAQLKRRLKQLEAGAS